MKAPLFFFIVGAFFLRLGVSLPIKEGLNAGFVDKEVLRTWLKANDKHRLKEMRQAIHEENVPKPGEIFEGDIIMDQDLREVVLGNKIKRGSLLDVSKRWPDKTIPYAFHSDVSTKDKVVINKALEDFARYTCIKVVIRTTQDNYVLVRTDKQVCSSYVGRLVTTGPQPIFLGSGCHRVGTILHEFMHSLGVVHEQSRPDRDEYVSIQWKHIKKDERVNFRKYSIYQVTNRGKDYDFSSVMHYGPYAFSKDGKKTILSKGKDVNYGQRRALSEGDVYEINKLYQCNHIQYDHRGLVRSTNGKRDFVLQDESELEDLKWRK